MLTTSHFTAAALCRLAVEYGVHRVFASPGARCAPLITALEAENSLTVSSVVDERSAAFMALGFAEISAEPVMLVCTSGTAVLNYAPAVAEAYFRRIPLIVVSADRPAAWINQNDSQTLPQPGALHHFVKKTINLQDIGAESAIEERWMAVRDINDAFLTALTEYRGPVHINLQFGMPLDTVVESDLSSVKRIEQIAPLPTIATHDARALGTRLAGRKVMIVCGIMPPSQKLSRAIARLAKFPLVVVLAEPLANIHCSEAVTNVDAAAFEAASDSALTPDVVISCGGALVSSHLKSFLRKVRPSEHWHIGIDPNVIDTFQCLTTRIRLAPVTFFPLLASAMQPHRKPGTFGKLWGQRGEKALNVLAGFANRYPESSLSVMHRIMQRLPKGWNVQVSNGMSVRLMQLCEVSQAHRISSNRGVSGIDGSTSTAVGAMMAYRHGVTLLLTGDMSLQYDLTVLGSAHITPGFKVIVFDNQGGNIFRTIPSTREHPALEPRFAIPCEYPVIRIAEVWGFKVFQVSSVHDLDSVWPAFTEEDAVPAMINVVTNGVGDAKIYHEYFALL